MEMTFKNSFSLSHHKAIISPFEKKEAGKKLFKGTQFAEGLTGEFSVEGQTLIHMY